MLKERVFTAIFALPILFYLLTKGSIFALWGFFCLCAMLSVYELSSMLLHSQRFWILFTTVLGGVIYLLGTWSSTLLSSARLGVLFVAISVIAVFASSSIEDGIQRCFRILTVISYGAMSWIGIFELYAKDKMYVILALAVVMLSDTGAYFAGKSIGRTPMSPMISPKKTWEGFFGGMLLSSFGTLFFLLWIPKPWLLITVGFFGGVAGVIGDLMESAFKRFSQVKDSGKIFPGHGGFLDRADSLIVAAPVIGLILSFFE